MPQATGQMAEVVVERLLGAAVADAEFAVRRKVLWEMRNNPALDALLAQADWWAPALSGAAPLRRLRYCN